MVIKKNENFIPFSNSVTFRKPRGTDLETASELIPGFCRSKSNVPTPGSLRTIKSPTAGIVPGIKSPPLARTPPPTGFTLIGALSKLQYLDFSQGALDWFQSYLSNRQQCVRIGDAVSKVLPLEFGVSQGSILGPVLFTIYVNDLLSVPKRCLSASYVDDCKLYLSFSPAELPTSILALNEDLTRISQWCCKNSLLINPDKTKVLAVGLSQLLKKLSSFSITLFDKEITPVPVVKDLGVLLDTRLSYNQHITETASKCLFKLYQINRTKHLLDRKTLLLVINSFVFSKLQYCSTVWSNTSSSNIDKLQKVQNFAGRIILGLRKYDHISDGLRSLKWLPIREKLI